MSECDVTLLVMKALSDPRVMHEPAGQYGPYYVKSPRTTQILNAAWGIVYHSGNRNWVALPPEVVGGSDQATDLLRFDTAEAAVAYALGYEDATTARR